MFDVWIGIYSCFDSTYQWYCVLCSVQCLADCVWLSYLIRSLGYCLLCKVDYIWNISVNHVRFWMCIFCCFHMTLLCLLCPVLSDSYENIRLVLYVPVYNKILISICILSRSTNLKNEKRFSSVLEFYLLKDIVLRTFLQFAYSVTFISHPQVIMQ